jgi:hypothetical protein
MLPPFPWQSLAPLKLLFLSRNCRKLTGVQLFFFILHYIFFVLGEFSSLGISLQINHQGPIVKPFAPFGVTLLPASFRDATFARESFVRLFRLKNNTLLI